MTRKYKGPAPISKNGRLPGVGMSIKTEINPFARWLKVARVRAAHRGNPITQEDLARLMGYPTRRIQKLEQGDQAPRLEWLDDFAAFFKVDVDELYLKTYNLPPDMQIFLTTTVEGERVVKNIRAMMTKMSETQKPTRKKGIDPKAEEKVRKQFGSEDGRVVSRAHPPSLQTFRTYEKKVRQADEDDLVNP